MSDKAAVIGKISVELVKKHGRIERIAENLVTGFGRSFIMTNGLAPLFNENTAQALNKIKSQYAYGSLNDLRGPYFDMTGPYYTKLARVTNLLLNGPNIATGQGLYKPEADELTAYAYQDTSSAATGGITVIKDGTNLRKALTRRYVYGSSISGEFNVIATSLLTPDETAGHISILSRSLKPALASGISVSGVNYSLLGSAKLRLIMSDNSKFDYDLETGTLVPTQDTFTAQTNTLLSIFTYKNITYILSTDNSSVYMDGYDSTGTKVLNNLNLGTYRYYDGYYYYKFKLWYDTTEQALFAVSNAGAWAVTAYKLTETNDVITSVEQAATYPTPPTAYSVIARDETYLPIGNIENGFYLNEYWDTYIARFDTTANVMKNAIKAQATFAYNNRFFTIAATNICNGSSASGETETVLNEYGNLISYHEFSTPFIKDVGDELYVSYSYYID